METPNPAIAPVEIWQWQNNKPPGPQSAGAGSDWQFRLPLTGNGIPPVVHWTNVPWRPEDQLSGSDPLLMRVKLPVNQTGIFKLHYHIEGHDHLDGVLHLKILPPTAEPQPHPAPVPKPSVLPVVPTPPEPKKVVPEPVKGNAVHPVPIENYQIMVYRNLTPILQLKTKLPTHKSLLVGKRSESKRIFPDIDLIGHFADSASESLCSREQARIYYSKGEVIVCNMGKSPLNIQTGNSIAVNEDSVWKSGEILEFPGGIKLVLEKVS